MAILTLSYSAQSSSAPTQSGWNAFKVDFEGTHTFTVADLTTDTNPEYVGNTFYSTKIVTLPSKGTLQLSSVNISAGDEILATDIALGLFIYVAESDTAGYTDSNCTFLVADENSLSYNNTANDLIFTAASNENEPPDSVGVITINLSNPETYTFTPENFTTETTPVYSDPEDDDAFAVKITSVPFYGSFLYDGDGLGLNESVTIKDINNGLLTYVTDEEQDDATSEDITFSVSDQGSYEFTSGGVLTLAVEAYVGSAPIINDETDIYVVLNEDYVFTRYDLITAAGYYDLDGDSAESIRFTSLPSQGEIQLDGETVSFSQEITLEDVDSGLLIYYTVDDALGEFEMNYQVKDASGEWSD
jgi:hypothetical protein